METNICPHCQTKNLLKAKYCMNCGFTLPEPQTEPISAEPMVVKKRNNNKIIIGVIATIAILVVVFFGIRSCVKSYIGDNGDKITTKLLEFTSKETNKNLPIQMDEYTTLDNTEVLPNKTFQYNYTITGIDLTTLGEENLKTLDDHILNALKENKELDGLKKLKTIFIHNYRDETGKTVHKFVITPELYE